MDALFTLKQQYRAAKEEATRLIEAATTQEEFDAADDKLAEAERLALKIRNARVDDVQTLASPSKGGVTKLPGGAVLLSNEASLSDYVRSKGSKIDPAELSLGRYVAARVTGSWKHAEAEREFMLAQGNFPDSAGGHTVPEQLASFVLDKARSQAVVVRAGAGTIPLETDSLRIPTVATDPTIVGKAENAAWTETSVAFGSLMLSPITFGAVLRSSRELWDDSPLAAQTFEQVLSACLAVHIDRLAIQGSGSGVEFLSLKSHPDLNEDTSIGAIAHEDLAQGVRKIEDANGVPNAIIMAPKTREDMSIIVSGDGSTAAKNWLGSPSTVVDLARYSTTGAPDDEVYIGDFSQCVFGMRMSPEIRVTEAGDAFPKFQVLIRIAMRATFAILRPTFFWRGTGLTH